MKTLNKMFLCKQDPLGQYLIADQFNLFGTNVEKIHESRWYRLLTILQ